MPCEKCQAVPHTHSFQILGRSSKGVIFMYSKPFDDLEKKLTEETIQSYYKHFDELKGKWVWLFDATNLHTLETPTLSVLMSFYKGMEARYKDSLTCMYILNPNWRLQTIVGMVRPFIRAEANERFIKNPSLLELVGIGMDVSLAKSLLHLEKKMD